jgi:hypothetical protein
MDVRDEVAMAEFFNPSGELFSPAMTSDWPRPKRVELNNGILTMWRSRCVINHVAAAVWTPGRQGSVRVVWVTA